MHPFSRFGFWLFVLYSLPVATAQSQLISSPPSVIALAGEDVLLPCGLQPPISASSRTVEWTRPGLDSEYIHVHQDGRLVYHGQNPGYQYRTALFVDQLINGNVSLKLYRVKMSDAGRYRCFLPSLWKESFIQLTVGAVSSPVVAVTRRTSSSVVLQCESAGWFPQPEVLWLDDEGNLLSAGPTETVRGPDDLYTVSSRVTVEKRHSNKFTCRVQQNNINQTRETWFHVPDEFFEVSSSCAASVAFSVIFCLLFVFVVAFLIWKWKQNKKQYPNEEGQQLMAEISKIEDLENKKTKLDEELQKNEEEQKNVTQTIDALKKILKDLETQKGEVTSQSQKAENMSEEHEKKMKLLDEEVMKKEGDQTANKAQGYLKLKDIMSEVRGRLDDRKKDHQQLIINTERIMKTAYEEVKKQEEKKQKLETSMELMKQQLEEIEKQKDALQSKLPSDKVINNK